MNAVVENLDALVDALGGLNVACMTGAEVVAYVEVWRNATARVGPNGPWTTEQIRMDAARRKETSGNVTPLRSLAEQIVDAGRRRRGEIP